MHPHNDHSHGLGQDLPLILARTPDRRAALRWLGAGALASVAPLGLTACGGGGDAGTADTTATTSTSTSTSSSTSTSCTATPQETAGPYPGDGTNSNGSGVVNVLTQTGIVRSDIRTSFNGLAGTAAGVPLTVTLQLVNSNASCASLAGYAVYLWHCTRDGQYSLYSSSVLDQNFLRGLQVADADGKVTFTTIFPGCYSGRWPHMHFEIYRSLSVATSGSNDVLTSQLAMPAAACGQVYGHATGYDTSVSNFAAISLTSDNVFGEDGGALQLATVSGSVAAGYTSDLRVVVPA